MDRRAFLGTLAAPLAAEAQALVLQPCAYVMGRSVLSSPPAIVPLGEKAGRSLDNEYF